MWAMRGPRLLWIGIGAALYYGAARLGLSIAFVHGTVAAVWPPTGVALALLVLGGPRMLPAVFFGELAADLTNGSPLLVSVAFGIGSCCEALAGYGLLRLVRFRPDLRRLRDVFALLGLAAPISPIASATIGTGALLAAGSISGHELWSTWHVWWLGDVTGDVIVAPLLLVAVGVRLRWPGGWRIAEAAGFLATLAVLAAVAHQLTLGIAYLVLPVLLWAALRFRQQGAVVANTVLAGVGVTAAAGAASEVARVSVLDRILFTQNFVIVGALTTLVLAALSTERERSAAALRRSTAQARRLASEQRALGQVATAIAREKDADGVLTLVAERAAALIGGERATVLMRRDGADVTVAAWPEANRSRRPGNVLSVPIQVSSEDWGTLEVSGVPPAAPVRPLQQLADLAGLSVSTARTRERLLADATTDSLTGVANQRLFRRRLTEEIARAHRYRRPLAVMLVDVDDLKAINDASGHLAGDRALAEVACRLRVATREEGVVARVGGDEFAVLLPECDGIGAHAAGERVRQAISATPIAEVGLLTASVGITELTAEDSDDALLQRCDRALYGAKLSGRDRCLRYSRDLDPALSTASS